MAGYKAGRAGGYPHFFRNSVDMDTPEKIKTMAYYDVVNFAKLIKADTYITWDSMTMYVLRLPAI